ncbi:acyl-CoA dehydrogenase family protein [Mumia sp. zg.B53]|uniref:acyl-CoA dehydrogenase family protein n=1 Tax=unclassified Mumia TaxID=2621872 RepID=UPI001C6DF199|nr:MULTISPECIES: acyl-CoA dehydrogenase [unclassified Mumia]MBW9204414.1 acyl-CoA dehydrogenase family protein [Mumia sp. zg.B17]MBW9214205.1 acyl-CoA dehydrogenase family protein [Mumia sp. zg.B53]
MADLGTALRSLLDGPYAQARESTRDLLASTGVLTDPSHRVEEQRTQTREALLALAKSGIPAAGFAKDHGGTGDPGASIVGFEMLVYADVSLMVKAGVQWGLFGGAVENLGTQRHHDTYLPRIIDGDLLGCFAMTETGHGSDVQSLETTATYDAATGEFIIDSPTATARKDYIGGAAHDATLAAVFAQLVTAGPGEEAHSRGVHCLLVPLRDDEGRDLPGVTTSDCGVKGGLNGVDNGRIVFDQVRVPRENLLDRYASVAEDGTYSSPIENPNRRFFTMLGTLIRGRVSIAGASGAAARQALAIAVRYALRRRQFGAPGAAAGEPQEVLLMDYRTHQRRLLPALARAYALQTAQNGLVETLSNIQGGGAVADPTAQRDLEALAAGVKAYASWHATETIQECREACGGAGYMAANRLTTLKADTDVFTTFEGDNTVLMQLVGKELLTGYADDVRGLDPLGMASFAVSNAAEVVLERTPVAPLVARLRDATRREGDEPDLLDRGTQISLLTDREEHLLDTLARRMQAARKLSGAEAFAAVNRAQDHLVHLGRAHVERVVLESFVAAVCEVEDDELRSVLDAVCDLYALSVVEADKAWFLEHRRLSVGRAKNVTASVNALCERLRPHAADLVDAFGIPENLLDVEMLR